MHHARWIQDPNAQQLHGPMSPGLDRFRRCRRAGVKRRQFVLFCLFSRLKHKGGARNVLNIREGILEEEPLVPRAVL